MKVNKSFTSFTGEIDIGRLSFFICLDKYGYYVDNIELAEQSVLFNRVVIYGNDLEEQRDDIVKFLRKMFKLKPEFVIEINCTANFKPIVINEFPSIKYNVTYTNNCDKQNLEIYNRLGANIKFKLNSVDEADNYAMIAKELFLKKENVFFVLQGETTEEDLDRLINICKFYRYNFSLEFHKMFWNKEVK